MTQVVDDFAAAARRFKGETKLLLIDGAQGGLLASFISPLTHPKGFDSLAFPQAVVEAVRSGWDGPLGFRLSVTDLSPGGISMEQAVSAAANPAGVRNRSDRGVWTGGGGLLSIGPIAPTIYCRWPHSSDSRPEHLSWSVQASPLSTEPTPLSAPAGLI